MSGRLSFFLSQTLCAGNCPGEHSFPQHLFFRAFVVLAQLPQCLQCRRSSTHLSSAIVSTNAATIFRDFQNRRCARCGPYCLGSIAPGRGTRALRSPSAATAHRTLCGEPGARRAAAQGEPCPVLGYFYHFGHSGHCVRVSFRCRLMGFHTMRK